MPVSMMKELYLLTNLQLLPPSLTNLINIVQQIVS